MPENTDALKKRKQELSDQHGQLTAQLSILHKNKASQEEINALDKRIDDVERQFLDIKDKLRKFLVKDGEEIRMGVEEKLDRYLNEAFEIDQEAIGTAVSSLTTGMKRVQYKLQKANTPQKYTEAFDMVAALVTNFPLKTKMIWDMVADTYEKRFVITIRPSKDPNYKESKEDRIMFGGQDNEVEMIDKIIDKYMTEGRSKAWKEYRTNTGALIFKNNGKRCDICGKHKPVTWVPDPYIEDIYHEKEYKNMCEDCYDEQIDQV